MQLPVRRLGKNRGLQKEMLLLAWIFVMPVLLIRLLTTLYPVAEIFHYSLLDYDLINRTKEYTGFSILSKSQTIPLYYRDCNLPSNILFYRFF